MLLYLAFCAIIVAVEGGESQCPGSKLTKQEREDFLNLHNEFRSQLANGTLKNKDGEYMPQGRNMLKLRWDCELEKSAQEWVDECNFDLTAGENKEFGENLYTLWSTSIKQVSRLSETAVKDAVEDWMDELQTDYRNNPSNLYANPNATYSHFTQMAWGKTYKLGCGVDKDCDEGYTITIVCYYSPAGNTPGELIYELGKPCKKSRDCETKKCDKKSGLCEKKRKVKK